MWIVSIAVVVVLRQIYSFVGISTCFFIVTCTTGQPTLNLSHTTNQFTSRFFCGRYRRAIFLFVHTIFSTQTHTHIDTDQKRIPCNGHKFEFIIDFHFDWKSIHFVVTTCCRHKYITKWYNYIVWWIACVYALVVASDFVSVAKKKTSMTVPYLWYRKADNFGCVSKLSHEYLFGNLVFTWH